MTESLHTNSVSLWLMLKWLFDESSYLPLLLVLLTTSSVFFNNGARFHNPFTPVYPFQKDRTMGLKVPTMFTWVKTCPIHELHLHKLWHGNRFWQNSLAAENQKSCWDCLNVIVLLLSVSQIHISGRTVFETVPKMSCCYRTIFLYAMSMYYSHWLKRAQYPIAGQEEVRWEN